MRYGRVLRRAELGVAGDGPWVVLDGGGAVLAVYRRHKETLVKPVMVLAPAPAPPEGTQA